MPKTCKHVAEIKLTGTSKRACEDCAKTGDTWVHLRMCLYCGHVGCCDSSKNKRATKHFHSIHHALVRSTSSASAAQSSPRRRRMHPAPCLTLSAAGVLYSLARLA